MKTKHDRYILTLKNDKEILKLYYNNKLNIHKVLNAKTGKCVWYWIGMMLDEILPCYRDRYEIEK